VHHRGSVIPQALTRNVLTEGRVARTPIAQFHRWYAAARRSRAEWSDVIALATSDPAGRPSVRAVILRSVDARGFVFYTDRRSRKGSELTRNDRAAFAMLWPALKRQVRVEGRVELVDDAESDAYFATRPRGSQLAAWASHQSRVIADRRALEQRVRAIDRRFNGKRVPRPPYWGGYRLVPTVVEFWQGRGDRLHDRLRYRRARGGWTLSRLAP
jgi:pyridoxamine 5'-phosphate oxidase